MKYQNTLKELLALTQTASDLSVAVNYFLTHFAENSSILEDSAPCKNNLNLLKKALAPVAQKYGAHVTVNELYVMQLQRTDLIHGLAILSNHLPISIYYFKDSKIGLAFASMDMVKTDIFKLSLLDQKPSVH